MRAYEARPNSRSPASKADAIVQADKTSIPLNRTWNATARVMGARLIASASWHFVTW